VEGFAPCVAPLALVFRGLDLRLTPWAIFCRASGAGV
jgi:hypothetical protein